MYFQVMPIFPCIFTVTKIGKSSNSLIFMVLIFVVLLFSWFKGSYFHGGSYFQGFYFHGRSSKVIMNYCSLPPQEWVLVIWRPRCLWRNCYRFQTCSQSAPAIWWSVSYCHSCSFRSELPSWCSRGPGSLHRARRGLFYHGGPLRRRQRCHYSLTQQRKR